MRVEIYWCKTKLAYLNTMKRLKQTIPNYLKHGVEHRRWDTHMSKTGILIANHEVKVGHIDEFIKQYPNNPVYIAEPEPTPADSIRELVEQDKINMPSHYVGRHGLEAIEVVRNFSTPEQEAGFYYGNAIKYLTRYQKKNGIEDLKKARRNLDWLIELLEEAKQ